MPQADTIQEVRRILRDETWEDYHTNSVSSHAAGATFTVTVPDGTKWEVGDILEWYEDGTGEQGFVRSIATNDLTTVGGYNGTTATPHSSNARIRKRPRFSWDQINAMVSNVIDQDLWPQIFVVSSTTLTPSPTTTLLYSVPADYQGFVDLIQVTSGTITDLRSVKPVEELFNVPTAQSATNKALKVVSWPRTDVTATLFYRAKPTASNIDSSLEKIVAIGVAARLLRNEAAEKADRTDELDRPSRMEVTSNVLAGQFATARSNYQKQLLNRYTPSHRRFVRA